MRAIDADVLKDVIQQHDYLLADRLNSIDNGMFTIGIFQAIDEQPTLSPDDVRGVGKWVKNHDEVMWWWECSNCKEKPLISRFGDAEVLSAYCPRCGAKMEVTAE